MAEVGVVMNMIGYCTKHGSEFDFRIGCTHCAIEGYDERYHFVPAPVRLAHQSRVDSFMEAVTNTAVGFVVTLAASPLIYAMTGVSITLHQMAGATLLFTVVSVARQYILRRLFNGRSVWSAIRGR